jgi:hypothetical protein
MTKIAGSGSISERRGSADPDPDPHQNVMDPQQCPEKWESGKARNILSVNMEKFRNLDISKDIII